MSLFGDVERTDYAGALHRIRDSERSDAAKIAAAFDWITMQYLEHAQSEVELARAMKDETGLVKAHIKHSMMEHARGIFAECYRVMVGEEAWNDNEAE
jgi:hypothetical protein